MNILIINYSRVQEFEMKILPEELRKQRALPTRELSTNRSLRCYHPNSMDMNLI